MTKEKLLKNLKKQFNEFGWALDKLGVQEAFIEEIEKDLDEFEETVKKNCTGLSSPKSIDLHANL